MVTDADKIVIKTLKDNGFSVKVLMDEIEIIDFCEQEIISHDEIDNIFEIQYPKFVKLKDIIECQNTHLIVKDKLSESLQLLYIPQTSLKLLAIKPLSNSICSSDNSPFDTRFFVYISDGQEILYSNTEFLNLETFTIDSTLVKLRKFDPPRNDIIEYAKTFLINSKENSESTLIIHNGFVSLAKLKFQNSDFCMVKFLPINFTFSNNNQYIGKLTKIEKFIYSISIKAYANDELNKYINDLQNEIIKIFDYEFVITSIYANNSTNQIITRKADTNIDNDLLSFALLKSTEGDKPIMIDFTKNNVKYFCRSFPLWIKTENIGEIAFITSSNFKDQLFIMDKLIPLIRLSCALILLKNIHKTNIIEIEKLRTFRSEILETVNHDMKRPLTSVMGYAELLQMGVIAEKKQVMEVGRSLNNAGNQMLNLIKELEKLSKKTLIVPKITLKPILTAEFIKDSAKMMMPIFESSGLEFVVDIPEYLPSINADLSKLYEIVLNLLSNASKYTESGGKVTLGAEIMMNNYIKIFIKDSGIGIPQDKKKIIFNKYSRLNYNKSGTGLGLYLSKVYTESMGGKLFVESEGTNKGSTFYLMLPFI